ncbi:MAG: protease pro-enzyme activation domain-containing protein, partial [Solirubrobacteraceae bacterium]
MAAGLVPISAASARTIRVGRAEHAALAGVTPSVAAGLPMHVTVTLRPRDPSALAAYARAVSTPGSAVYHRFLSPAQFARRFGATAGQITEVRDALGARGLRPGRPSAGRLSIPVAASAGSLQRAFSVSLHRLRLPGRRIAVVADAAPALAARAAADFQAVVCLDTTAAPRPLLARASRSPARSARPRPHVV